MRIMLILAALAAVAITFHIVWLGQLIFLFIFGCALFGFGEAVIDVATGNSTLTAGGRKRHLRRHLQSLPPNFNPRYGTLRLRGVSHEECERRGVCVVCWLCVPACRLSAAEDKVSGCVARAWDK